MKTYKSMSTVRPDTWDKVSCPDKVYHHTNIHEVPVETEGQDPVKMYAYDTTEYTNREYLLMLDDQVGEQADALIELAGMIGGE